MHLDNKKMPLLVPLLEPVLPRAARRRRRNLPPRSMASQYSTPNGGHSGGPRKRSPRPPVSRMTRNAAANGLHADEHAVKPHGTRRNRTSSAANGAPAGSVRSSRGGNRGFFQNPPPPDGPRRPQAAPAPLPAADAHALGNGRLAGGGAPCPARWPDTAGPPAAATRAAPRPRRLYYSTAKEDAAEKTTSRTPSADKSAHDNGPGLAVGSEEQSCWTTDQGSANSRRSSPGSGASTPLRGALDRSPPARPPSVQLNHPAAALPTHSGDSLLTWPPFRRDSCARALAPSSRETGPQFRRD